MKSGGKMNLQQLSCLEYSKIIRKTLDNDNLSLFTGNNLLLFLTYKTIIKDFLSDIELKFLSLSFYRVLKAFRLSSAGLKLF